MGTDYATEARKAQDLDQWWSMVSKVPDGYVTRDWLIEYMEFIQTAKNFIASKEWT